MRDLLDKINIYHEFYLSILRDYSKIISIFAVYHKYYVTTILIYKSNNKASDRKVYSYEEKNITSR